MMKRLIRLRELSEKYSRWHSLGNFINRIELGCSSDLDSAISNANSLVETIFKTILFERVEKYQQEPSKLKFLKIKPLANETLKSMNLVRHTGHSKFISGMVTSLENLGEIRNSLSHGQNLYLYEYEKTEELAAYFLVSTVESISCFLIEFYEVEFPLKGKVKEKQYEDYQDFNECFDEEHGTLVIAGIPDISSSLALFHGDRKAYMASYQDYLSGNNSETDREPD